MNLTFEPHLHVSPVSLYTLLQPAPPRTALIHCVPLPLLFPTLTRSCTMTSHMLDPALDL